MREHEVLEQPLRKARAIHRRLEAIADQDRLRRVLEQHRIARHQRRDDRIHRGQIRIIPRRDGEHDAERLAPHIAPETLLGRRLNRRQRTFGDGHHIAGAFLEAAHFGAAVFHWPAHLPGKFRADFRRASPAWHRPQRGRAWHAPPAAPAPRRLVLSARRRRRRRSPRPRRCACARPRAHRREKCKRCRSFFLLVLANDRRAGTGSPITPCANLHKLIAGRKTGARFC